MPASPASPIGLAALSRSGGAAASQIARPPSRFVTRVLIPGAIVLAVFALVAYAARESFRPAIAVSVAPAVPRLDRSAPAAAASSIGSDARSGPAGVPVPRAVPTEIVQAPGWIEADPNAAGVPALAPGVLKELPVLDGQRIEVGQIVARLVDDEARLAVDRAQAELATAGAGIAQAKAAVAAEEARAKELAESLRRMESVRGTGAVPEGEVIDSRLKLASQQAQVAAARAAVARAEADEVAARVTLKQAELTLSRMTVVSPVAGVVLQRLLEPGQRLMPDANNPYAGVVLRVYDPAHLQVRVDVPLSDAGKVKIGDSAEITTETLPGRSFKGTLTRFVHEANLQKNTVQVKIAIADPAPELKPDMLAKAKITTGGSAASPTQGAGSGGGSGGASSPPTSPSDPHAGHLGHDPSMSPAAMVPSDGTVLMIPKSALIEVSGVQAFAWVLDRASSGAVKRPIRLGALTADTAEVLEGLRPGDRVVLDPPAALRPGLKVRPLGEETAQ